MKRGGYGEDFQHRFGKYGKHPDPTGDKKRIWIQAVSVGELQAIKPLVEQLKDGGNYWIAVTTTTSTAYRILQKDFSAISDFRGYFPLDFLPFIKRAWKQIRPDTAILMESELWPEHMYQAKRAGVPLLLINARMSDRSFKRYSKLRFLTVFMTRYISAVAASSQVDADRFRSLGIPKQRIAVAGNLKLDKDIQPRLSDSEINQLKREMGFSENARVILGSSTWPGEEAMLCRIFNQIKTRHPEARLLIVPRHAERKSELQEKLPEFALKTHFRSDSKTADSTTELYIADTTGELPMLTQIADLAFIGKSMPPHSEAQSMIEPAILGIPALIGPGYSNFKPIVEGLLQAGLIESVADEEHLAISITQKLAEAPDRSPYKTRAQSWHLANKGSLKRTLEQIETA